MSLRRSLTRRGPGQRRLPSGPDALADDRDFLQRSIEDLERERASGEVQEEDFALLHSRYGQRLVEVEAAIANLASDELTIGGQGRTPGSLDALARLPDSSGRHEAARSATLVGRLRRGLGRRRVRLVLGTAAACCFVVAATLLAASLAGVRLPGESATGSVSLSSAQQVQETLDRAAILGSEDQAAEAVQLYDQVLQTDPNQPDALTYGGWLVRLAGLSAKNRLVLAKGDASVARAVKVAPAYPDAHALLGVILYEDFGRPAAAVDQFREALAVGASKNLLASVAPVAVKAFTAAKRPLPPRYVAAMKSVTATGGG